MMKIFQNKETLFIDWAAGCSVGVRGEDEIIMKIYLDGKLVDKADAKVSVFDHGLLYGDGVFEGIIEGALLGGCNGINDGTLEGVLDGGCIGVVEGTFDGALDGVSEGEFDGGWIGDNDGALDGGCCGVYDSHIKYIHDQITMDFPNIILSCKKLDELDLNTYWITNAC